MADIYGFVSLGGRSGSFGRKVVKAVETGSHIGVGDYSFANISATGILGGSCYAPSRYDQKADEYIGLHIGRFMLTNIEFSELKCYIYGYE